MNPKASYTCPLTLGLGADFTKSGLYCTPKVDETIQGVDNMAGEQR